MIELKGIKKVNESLDPELLSWDEATELINMVLNNDYRKPSKRGAIKIYNDQDTGAVIYSIFSVYNGNEYLLILSDGDLKKSLAGTGGWSDIKTGLTATSKLRMTPFADKFVFTNNTEAPFVTDLTYQWNLEIERPDISGITTVISTGGSLTGEKLYRYIMQYTAIDGSVSDFSFPFTYVDSQQDIKTTDATNKTVEFTDLPISSDTRVKGRKLFRTKAAGSVYYLLATMDNSTTDYIDTEADTELDVSESITYINVPETVKSLCAHKNRLILSNVTLNNIHATLKPAWLPLTTLAADHSSAGLSDGTYKHAVSFLDVYGNESELSPSVTTVVDRNVGGWVSGEAQITLSGIPMPRSGAADDLYEDILAVRIYRTKAGGALPYYLVKDLTSLPDYSDVDATHDDDLGDEYPASLFFDNPLSYPSRVYYSDIDKISQVKELNYFEVFASDGDGITATVDFQDRLVHLKELSICETFTEGSPINWQTVKVIDKIGCDTMDSIVTARNRIYFMYKNSVYRYPDYLARPLSEPLEDTFSAITSVYSSTYLSKYNWYVLVVLSGGTRYTLIYDEQYDCWYKFNTTGSTLQSVVEKQYGTDKGSLIFGDGSYGILMVYDPSSKLDYSASLADDVTEINCSLKFKTFIVNDPNALIRLRKLFSNYKKRDNQNVSHLLYCADDALQKLSTDGTNSSYTSDYKLYEVVTDAMTGSLKTPNKFYYKIYGTGLDEFNGAKIEYRIINHGRR